MQQFKIEKYSVEFKCQIFAEIHGRQNFTGNSMSLYRIILFYKNK